MTELKQEEAEDEEIRIAMEMALAAARNPHLSPDEIRGMVSANNKQTEIVDKIRKEQEEQKRKEQEEAQKQWEEQKAQAIGWIKSKTEGISEAAQQAAILARDEAEKRMYAEDIKADKEVIDLRKQMKIARKTLKAHRLHGNREETRHAFKRQRMEKELIKLVDNLERKKIMFTSTKYKIKEYAFAMLKASKKWKKQATDEELTLEAQLCRNMHQMLAIDKQKSKVKKSSREMKKYLQRCKSWLQDKKAFCEMSTMNLDASANTMNIIYEDTLDRQDKLIKKLIESEEFKNIDLEGVEINLNFDEIPAHWGPGATLNALRGLPIEDSVRLQRTIEEGEVPTEKAAGVHRSRGGRPELYIEAGDDDSVNSALSDPDEPFTEQNLTEEEKMHDSMSNDKYGADAPWNRTDAASADSGSGDAARTAEAVITQVGIERPKKRPPKNGGGKEEEPTEQLSENGHGGPEMSASEEKKAPVEESVTDEIDPASVEN